MKKFLLLIMLVCAQVSYANGVAISTASIEEKDSVYTVVEVNASFPGGTDALYKWIGEHMKYPKICQEHGIEGRVVVGFTIEKNGKITGVEVKESPNNELSKEAIRVVSSMPKWRPASIGDEKVRSRFLLPLMFRLSAGKTAKAQ